MKSMMRFLAIFVLLIGQEHLAGQEVSATAKRWDNAGKQIARPVRNADGIAPLVNTRWGEGCFYNASCPVDTASNTTCLHVPAGSGAIAMAQILNYYQYPAHGNGEHGYPHAKYGIQYANFGATTFNWSTMPDSLTSMNDGLATLIYQCGVAQNMNYGSQTSVSLYEDIDSAFVKYFSYPVASNWKSKLDYSTADWIALLKTELDASHPVLYVGYNSTADIRQYFICDGYQGDSLFHFNWGMGGKSDGYFTLNSLMPDSVNFSFGQHALFNLAPALPGADSYVMDFENVTNFSLTFNDWTVKDVDQHDTYGITGYTYLHQTEPMAFLSFNPAQVSPSMASDLAIQPHSGQRFGACFSSNPPSNNDWFISPQIQLGINGSFSFWIKSYNDTYGLDNYEVAVSTTDNNPASFTVISGLQPLQTTVAWTKKMFNLSNFDNQKVYIAIHCVSNDNFLMMIDDLEVKPQASTTLTADFTADKTLISMQESVNFTDQSSGVPVSWAWKFPGGTPSTSSLQNPVNIEYATPGVYPVSLLVSNGLASDSVTKSAYITVTGYASSMSLDFESLGDFVLTFNPWTVLDVNGGDTYGIESVSFPNIYEPAAYICFNPAKTSPPLVNMSAHSGQKLGCSFSSPPPNNPSNKWLVSPRMYLGINAQIDFWVMAYNNQWGDEKYNVAVSVTDLNPASFIALNASPEIAPTSWTKRIYDLSAYANRAVYVGIQCVSDNSFIFMIDDITISSSIGIGEKNSLTRLVVYPNPTKDFFMLNCPALISSSLTIEMVSILGEKIALWRETLVEGRIRLDVHGIPQGIYLLRISSGTHEVVRKVSVIK